ncbi:hypothetical protein ACA910_003629 [Epithemia clementina (nom. ined.)]
MVPNPDCTGQWAKTSPINPEYDLQRLVPNGHQEHNHHAQSNFSDDAAAYVATTTTSSFCSGGTSMYMNGFQWMNTTCVIFLNVSPLGLVQSREICSRLYYHVSVWFHVGMDHARAPQTGQKERNGRICSPGRRRVGILNP